MLLVCGGWRPGHRTTLHTVQDGPKNAGAQVKTLQEGLYVKSSAFL